MFWCDLCLSLSNVEWLSFNPLVNQRLSFNQSIYQQVVVQSIGKPISKRLFDLMGFRLDPITHRGAVIQYAVFHSVGKPTGCDSISRKPISKCLGRISIYACQTKTCCLSLNQSVRQSVMARKLKTALD